MVELYGKRIRVWARRENGDIFIEITSIWDPSYEKPVVLITSKSKIKEDVESLISEIVLLLRELVEKVVEEAERSEVQ